MGNIQIWKQRDRRSCGWGCNLLFGCSFCKMEFVLVHGEESEIGLDQDISVEDAATLTTETVLLFVMRL